MSDLWMSSPIPFSVMVGQSVRTSQETPTLVGDLRKSDPGSGLIAFGLSFTRGFEMPELTLQPGVLLLQPLSFHLDVFHALRGTDRHFLDDLDKAPETQNDDKGGNFLDDTTRQSVNEETSNNDQGVEKVKPGPEVSCINCQ